MKRKRIPPEIAATENNFFFIFCSGILLTDIRHKNQQCFLCRMYRETDYFLLQAGSFTAILESVFAEAVMLRRMSLSSIIAGLQIGWRG